MDAAITPEPHLIPGYTGHCPQFRHREGKTYGQLSHKLLLDPCINHAPELIVTAPSKKPLQKNYPTEEEIAILHRRKKFLDAVYRHPMIPGYEGFVPKVKDNFGKTYRAAATSGVATHENLMDRLRCERRCLTHRDLLESGNGRFEHKLGERLLSHTAYRAPLIPVRPRAQGIHHLDCCYKEKIEPYSKFTSPHFMEPDDKEKFIVNGYGGHVPFAMTRFGQSQKQLTNSALCEFTNNYHHRQSAEWCPIEMTGVGTSCPNSGQFIIYPHNMGMLPCYSGHVPGADFTYGRTFGMATVNAKNWLARHKD